MTLRLRQVALAARDLERAAADIRAVFAPPAPFHDPGVATFGLHNAVFALGDTFLEVVSPVREDASAARFLVRKGGDAGYMAIFQSDDLARERQRLDRLGVRVVFELALEDIATIHLHPRDIGGAIVSLDEANPPASWRWAGPTWQQTPASRVTGVLCGVDIAARQPDAMAARWAEVLGTSRVDRGGNVPTIPLEGAVVRFVGCRDVREEGLTTVDVVALDRDQILNAARSRGLATGDDVTICGTRFRLLDH